jgi:hypothetical protein
VRPAIERPEVVEGLRALLEAGLAKVYDLLPGIGDPFAGELQGLPPLNLVEQDFRTFST